MFLCFFCFYVSPLPKEGIGAIFPTRICPGCQRRAGAGRDRGGPSTPSRPPHPAMVPACRQRCRGRQVAPAWAAGSPGPARRQDGALSAARARTRQRGARVQSARGDGARAQPTATAMSSSRPPLQCPEDLAFEGSVWEKLPRVSDPGAPGDRPETELCVSGCP